LLTVEEYLYIKNKVFKGRQLKTDGVLLDEIKVQGTDASQPSMIDIGKLVEVIDFCNHFPMIVKRIKNKSNDIYFILSSNMRDNFDAKALLSGVSDP
jgi:hypothetical protein